MAVEEVDATPEDAVAVGAEPAGENPGVHDVRPALPPRGRLCESASALPVGAGTRREEEAFWQYWSLGGTRCLCRRLRLSSLAQAAGHWGLIVAISVLNADEKCADELPRRLSLLGRPAELHPLQPADPQSRVHCSQPRA